MQAVFKKPRILILDDEPVIGELLQRSLAGKDYEVVVADDSIAALDKIKKTFFNLLITDLKMPKADGMSVLKEIKRINPYIEVIIITGYPTIKVAVEAIKIGAFDFICKPFDLDYIQRIVKRCLEKQKFSINYMNANELAALFDVSKKISTNTNLNYLLSHILDSALRIVGAQRGSLMLVNEETQELEIKAASNLSGDVIDNTRVKIGEGICGRVAAQGKPLIVDDIERDPTLRRNRKTKYTAKSFVSIPLLSESSYSHGKVLGVLNITGKLTGEPFTKRETTILSLLAGQAVTAIENYRLYHQLQEKVRDLEGVVTELHSTQNQLVQSEKMATVGQLAFGIAHEIRNPLGTIMGGVDFLNHKMEKNGETEESIEKIKQSIDRVNKIIVGLLRFSKTTEFDSETVNVSQIMDEVVGLIANQAYLRGVHIFREYGESCFFAKANPTMLRQVFLNLCMNALDAMPGGGALTLEIYFKRNPEKKENDIIVEIEDTGEGIPKEMIPSIFIPFFSTKKERGTGLGLSIVHLILDRFGGRIDVRSTVGKGTKFIITLPVGEINSL